MHQVDPVPIIIACGLLIVVVLIGAALVLFVRARITNKDNSSAGGFTLGDLREMKRTGKMSDEEFEKARNLIVAAAKRSIAKQVSENAKKPDRDR